MKALILILCVSFLSFNILNPRSASRIIGTATPSLGVKKVAAFDGKDSVFSNTSTGTFAIEVRAGNWKLIVLAVPPYKDAVLENVVVQEGQDTDVGEIRLSQK